MPRELVHKKAVGEVLLTGAATPRPDVFTVFAKWPRRHRFYHPDPTGLPDPLLFVETVRQAGIYLSHRYYQVPLDFRFVFQELTDLTVDHPAPAAHGPVTATTYCRPTTASHGRFAASMDVVLSAGSERLGRASVRWIALRDAAYQRIRGRRERSATAPNTGRLLRPAEVGRLRDRDVLLLDDSDSGGWRLRLDERHPYYFDHPTDHVPGMVLLEAFRQVGWCTAARILPTVRLIGLSTGFRSFCELDVPVFLDGEQIPGDEVSVRVVATQSGRTAATGTLTFAPCHQYTPDLFEQYR
ncbi:ScbA/BarX family gamma-butyrolactone biosynthesis protein [Actinophytocola sp.]|uniref:ScbA/BarX family gamma-butyrolactone biosynthesis protein n=1 Tax=Actinophytocola sp. TaxID=1872138 RepID=UPI00389A3B58